MTKDNGLLSQEEMVNAVHEGRFSEIRDQFLIKKGMNLATRELLGELEGKVPVAQYDQLEATLERSEREVESSLQIMDLFIAMESLRGF